jgi:prepilin-type N-terminal cleavage/methylation domain-containing protein
MLTARAAHVARDERGFSLVELLVAMALGSMVLTAVMTVFINGLTGTAKVTDRIDAVQRARLTADRMTTLLQAQVCSGGSAPITDGQATSVTFTANVGDVTANPTRYRLRWDNTTNRIYEDRFVPTTDSSGNVTFPSSPTQTKVIGTDMVPAGGTLFTYNAFDTVNAGVSATPIATPLTTTDMQTVVAVSVSLVAQPERTKVSDERATTLTTQAVVGSADATNPNRGPKC